MDPELKRMLDETRSLAKDNHRMLRALRRHQLIGAFGKIIFWLVILGGSAYWYQIYLQPLVAKFSTLGSPSAVSNLFGLPTSAELQKLLNSFKVGQ
ncbi:MAG: hypothetical protein AAB689_01440 [Patescibacteria group bacterium]